MTDAQLLRRHSAHCRAVERLWNRSPPEDNHHLVTMPPVLIIDAVGPDGQRHTLTWEIREPPSVVDAIVLTSPLRLHENRLQIQCASVAGEAWVSDEDERVEVLAVETAASDTKTLTTLIRIGRSSGGEPTLLDDWLDSSDARHPTLASELFMVVAALRNA